MRGIRDHLRRLFQVTPVLAAAGVAAVTLDSVTNFQRCSAQVEANAKSNQGEDKASTVEWAYPHPYETDAEPERFVKPVYFRKVKKEWDLIGILRHWQQSEDETWPWVWCQPNPNGPHAVFIGIDKSTLCTCESLSAASPQQNLTLVVEDFNEIREAGLEASEFYRNRCAIIKSKPKQIDLQHRILMLEDERIVCYDSLHFARPRISQIEVTSDVEC